MSSKYDLTMWKVSAIVNGIVVTLYEDIRPRIFKRDPDLTDVDPQDVMHYFIVTSEVS